MRLFLLIRILLVGAASGGASLTALTDLKPIVLDLSYNAARFVVITCGGLFTE